MAKTKSKRAEFFEHLPDYYKPMCKRLLILSFISLAAGFIGAFLNDTKPYAETLMFSGFGMAVFCQGWLLVHLGIAVFKLNIDRNKDQLTTFSFNRHGPSESGSYLYNQFITVFYITLGIALIGMSGALFLIQ